MREDGYQSPITVAISKYAMELKNTIEELSVRECAKIGISIDKHELKRALSYDYHQYLRGYEFGRDEGRKEAAKSLIILLENTDRNKEELIVSIKMMYGIRGENNEDE